MVDEALLSKTQALECKMLRSTWMHVKFATLRDGWVVGEWIYGLEPLHGLESHCMD